MLPALVFRTLRSADRRCLWKFAWNFGFKGMLSVEKFKRRIKRGEYFPPFLYLSILNTCNLRCQGCWVDVESKDAIDLEALNRTILDAKRHGNAFFGILGGDIYSMLRMRSERAQSRFSKERDSGKALNERQKCLTKLAQAGDIPPEVLMSLPSPEEIQRRAEEARAKAQAALAAQR